MHSYKITGGVPQDLILGPQVWKVYDDILKRSLPEGVSIIAFADDVALVNVAREINEVKCLGDASIKVVAG